MAYQGEIFPGRHPAIITPELFDRVQRVLDMRSARGQRDRVLFHYLKGLLFCDRCRKAHRTSRLIYTEARGRAGRLHPYFLCRGRQDGLCDLPYLPVALVEEKVAEFHYWMKLEDHFRQETTHLIEETIADEQRIVRDLHNQFQKHLRELDVREERLIDLATDAALPRNKIRARLSKIKVERARAEEGLKETAAQLRVGAEALTTYMRFSRSRGSRTPTLQISRGAN